MLGVPPEPPDPRRKPKNPAGEGGITGLQIFILIVGGGLMIAILGPFLAVQNQQNDGDPLPADYQPRKPEPAKVVDNEAGLAIVYPPEAAYFWKNAYEAMLKAEGEWRKQHPDYANITMTITGKIGDYDYCWILRYDRK